MKAQFITFSKPKYLWYLLFGVGLSLTSCQNSSKSSSEGATPIEQPQSVTEAPNATKKTLTEDEAADIVVALPIVQKLNKQFYEASNGQRGVSLINEPDSEEVNGQEYYVVRVGYNGEDRFETYHFIYVNKHDKDDIQVYDPVEATIVPLAQWEQEN